MRFCPALCAAPLGPPVLGAYLSGLREAQRVQRLVSGAAAASSS